MDITTKDPQEAAEILEEEKQLDQCQFPGCESKKRRKALNERGAAPEYCDDPTHTPLKKERAVNRLRRIASGVTTLPKLPSSLMIASSRTDAIEAQRIAIAKMEEHLSLLIDSSDPEIAEAQAETNAALARQEINQAQLDLSKERELRLKAEEVARTAKELAEAEHQTAELALKQKKEAEDHTKEIEDATTKQIALIQRERDDTVKEIEDKASDAITEALKEAGAIKEQAGKTIENANKERDTAIQKAQSSHDATIEAKAATTIAETLRKQAQESLERESAEVVKLRTKIEEIEREHKKEIEKLEGAHEKTLARLDKEVDQLRSDLREARAQVEKAVLRADQQAGIADQLRAQLLQKS